jgi:hypothetical protein
MPPKPFVVRPESQKKEDNASERVGLRVLPNNSVGKGFITSP